MIDASTPPRAPAATLRVRALRLLAERQLGWRLTHVGAVERLERHGAVDAALDAMAAEQALAAEEARARRASRGEPRPLPARPEASHPAMVSGASVRAPSVPRTEARTRRHGEVRAAVRGVALATGGATALMVAVVALGRVWSAAGAAHGARWTLAFGSTALVVALLCVMAFVRRNRSNAPRLEVGAVGVTAVAAGVVGYVEECALPVPVGLEALLDPSALAVAVAGIAIATGGAALATAIRERPPGRA